jgi:hypothetical protein
MLSILQEIGKSLTFNRVLTDMDNIFLLVVFFIFISGLGCVLAYVADWLESRYPWKEPW